MSKKVNGGLEGGLEAFLFCLGILIGLLFGWGMTKEYHRSIECTLRYEHAVTASDSLTVIREHKYCELGS